MNKEYFDRIRFNRHISLEKLSELTMIPMSTLAKISAGTIDTSFEKMCRIAQALECSLDELADTSFALPNTNHNKKNAGV